MEGGGKFSVFVLFKHPCYLSDRWPATQAKLACISIIRASMRILSRDGFLIVRVTRAVIYLKAQRTFVISIMNSINVFWMSWSWRWRS